MGVSLGLLPRGLFLLLFVYSSLGVEVTTFDVMEASKALLKSDYGYLDVRTVEEYKKGHVDAKKIFNIPYMVNTHAGVRVRNPDFLKEVSTLCKQEDRLIVGCQSGVRSLFATSDLLGAGFKDVKNMGGGYISWVENGLPLKLEDQEQKEKEQQKSCWLKKGDLQNCEL